MADAFVTHTYAFDFGRSISHRALAARLLDDGVAELMVEPSSGEVRLSETYKSLAKSLDLLRELGSYENETASGLTWRYLRSASWRMRWILFKAIFGVVTRRGQGGSEREEEDPKADFKAEAEEMDRKVRDLSIHDLIRHAIDKDLYPGEYLAANPFYRLKLKSVDLKVSLLDSPLSIDDQRADLELVLHESGVAIMSIGYTVQEPVSLRMLASATRSDKARLTALRIPESIAKRYAKFWRNPVSLIRGDWEPDVSEGERWVRLRVDSTARVADVYDIVHYALASYFGNSISPAWLCHTTIAINHWDCRCSSRGAWEALHGSELARLLAGVHDVDEVRIATLGEEFMRDFSIEESTSFYSSGGTSIRVQWNFDASDTGREGFGLLNRLVVIENALIRYWQLRVLDAELDLTVGRSTSETAEDLQRRLIYGLVEQDRVLFMAGTATDLADHIFAELRGPRLRQQLSDRIDLLRNLVASQEARRASRRSIRLAAGALVAAIVLGLPAISQAFEVAGKANLLTLSEGDRSVVSVWVYVALVGAATLLALPGLWRARDAPIYPDRKRSRAPGFAWPSGQLDVTIVKPWLDELPEGAEPKRRSFIPMGVKPIDRRNSRLVTSEDDK
ncbi:hypothetical protein [Pseudonocardia sp. NPDC049154]|uniref:hypothetical protein n=1 Tax=Pseudonocardia sp. NPDC049154 TaxID=3155501 RepID=UPI00340EBBD8